MKKIRVFFSDDHDVVIKGLAETIDDYNSSENPERIIEIAGVSKTAEGLLENIIRTDIDVFITDIGYSSLQGDPTIVKLLLQKNPNAKILVFSTFNNPHIKTGSYSFGAYGYIPKRADKSLQRVIEALIAISDGKDYFIPEALEEMLKAALRDPLRSLEPREKQLFLMLAHEKPLAEVEKEMGISKKTIDSIITNKIKPVVGGSRKDFPAIARRLGLVEGSGDC
jgi:DNA-binding NarL/FixJ family response regulator